MRSNRWSIWAKSWTEWKSLGGLQGGFTGEGIPIAFPPFVGTYVPPGQWREGGRVGTHHRTRFSRGRATLHRHRQCGSRNRAVHDGGSPCIAQRRRWKRSQRAFATSSNLSATAWAIMYRTAPGSLPMPPKTFSRLDLVTITIRESDAALVALSAIGRLTARLCENLPAMGGGSGRSARSCRAAVSARDVPDSRSGDREHSPRCRSGRQEPVHVAERQGGADIDSALQSFCGDRDRRRNGAAASVTLVAVPHPPSSGFRDSPLLTFSLSASIGRFAGSARGAGSLTRRRPAIPQRNASAASPTLEKHDAVHRHSYPVAQCGSHR